MPIQGVGSFEGEALEYAEGWRARADQGGHSTCRRMTERDRDTARFRKPGVGEAIRSEGSLYGRRIGCFWH
jgi:hypothetical protein